MMKRSLSSFSFILFISLFIRGGGGCSDIHYIFEWGSAEPSLPHPQQKSTIFIKMGETSPVCREHVYTGRPRTRIDKSIFNKSNVMSFSTKKS